MSDSRTRLTVLPLEDRTTPSVTPGAAFVDGRILVGFTPGQEQQGLAALSTDTQVVTAVQAIGFGAHKVTLAPGVSVPAAIAAIEGRAGVRYAEPDYLRYKTATPNDPKFTDGTLWGMNNTGQNGGTNDADIDAPEGWDFGTGTGDHIVAVIDDGLDYTHPDLAANVWTNPGEVAGDGIDNDGNGYIDDVHGYDFSNGDGDPLPGAGDEHGTHVSGTIGAVGNNNTGVTGVAWKTKLMGVSFLGAGANQGSISAEVQCINYALAMGATIINGSFGGQGTNQAERDAFAAIDAAGAIAVVAAGNDGVNNDLPANNYFPANFSAEFNNTITVAAFDRNDNLASFSQYGRRNVTLGAPGVDIWSTQPGNQYQSLDGTSMATPHVTGALAVFWDAFPNLSAGEVVAALKRSVRPIPAANNKVSTDGVLNLESLMAQGSSSVYATGTGVGGGPHVKVYAPGGRLVTEFLAYDPAFRGGVRVATADVNGDRFADIITVAGPGGGPHVKVFDGRTFAEIASFYAFEPTFFGGLNVAAGDITGDGRADIIVGAEQGGGPRVTVFSLPNGATGFGAVADFYAYDQGFTGGVRVAAGMFTAGATAADVLTGPGLGGGPHVKLFRGTDLTAGGGTAYAETFAGNAADLSGVFVAAGDFNADGLADIVTGAGAGIATVRILDGQTLATIQTLNPPSSVGELPGLTNPATGTGGAGTSALLPGIDGGTLTTVSTGGTITPGLTNGLLPGTTVPNQLVVTSTTPKPVEQTGYIFGVRVAVMDVNRDRRPDLILAAGPNDRPLVSLVNGRTFNEIRRFNAYDPAFFGGVYVGGTGV